MPAWPPDLILEAMRLSAAGLSPQQIGDRIGKTEDAVAGRLRRRKHSLPKAAFQGGSGSVSPEGAPRVTPVAASPEPPASLGHEKYLGHENRVSSPSTRALYDSLTPAAFTASAVPDSRIPNIEHRSPVLEAFVPKASFLDQAPPLVKEPSAPAIHTSRTRGEAYLIVSDTQEPYSAAAALPFVLAVAREFNVDLRQPGSAYHVGDEVDAFNFSRFLRSPEATHTPNQELQAVKDKLAPWYAAIPYLRLCNSNHGDRILKKAVEAGLPSQLLRAHRDVIGAPPGWEWASEWRVQASRRPFMVEHGHHGGQSTAASRQRPAWNGISTAWGHMHAQAGVWHVKTHGQEVWGMCVGSLIDRDAVAFEYGKPNTWQPWLGVGVVLDGGRAPILVPYGGSWP